MLPNDSFRSALPRSCEHESCDRLVFSAAYSHHDAQFCSSEHKDETVQLKLRELQRLDDLLNKISMLNVKWLHQFCTFHSEEFATGLLVLHQKELVEPLQDQAPAVNEDIEEISVCFNSCLHAMQTLAGVLAYFAEGIHIAPGL